MKSITCRSLDQLIESAYADVKSNGNKFKRCNTRKSFKIKSKNIIYKTYYNEYSFQKKVLYDQILSHKISIVDFINKQLIAFL